MANTAQNLRIDYIEFPTLDTGKIKAFYSQVFGWKFDDYGPDYTQRSPLAAQARRRRSRFALNMARLVRSLPLIRLRKLIPRVCHREISIRLSRQHQEIPLILSLIRIGDELLDHVVSLSARHRVMQLP
jgi:hypothetical protein